MKAQENHPANREARRAQLEAKLGRAVKNYLDAGAQSVSADVAQRLQKARRAALVAMNSRSAAESVSVSGGALARAGGDAQGSENPTFWGAGVLVALALALYGVMSWDQDRRASEAADADLEILASEVPMDAYFDKGFKSFVEKSR